MQNSTNKLVTQQKKLLPTLKKWETIPWDGKDTTRKIYAFAKIESRITLKSCLHADSLRKTYKSDPTGTIAAVIAIIDQYSRSLNTYKEISQYQLHQMSIDIIDRFKHESLNDVILLFKYAREGRFGFRARFDSSVMVEWIPHYMELKAIEREHVIADREGRAAKARMETEGVMSPELKAKFAELRKSMSLKKHKRKGRLSPDTPLGTMDGFKTHLKSSLKSLTIDELKKYKKENTNPIVLEIVEQEIKLR